MNRTNELYGFTPNELYGFTPHALGFGTTNESCSFTPNASAFGTTTDTYQNMFLPVVGSLSIGVYLLYKYLSVRWKKTQSHDVVDAKEKDPMQRQVARVQNKDPMQRQVARVQDTVNFPIQHKNGMPRVSKIFLGIAAACALAVVVFTMQGMFASILVTICEIEISYGAAALIGAVSCSTAAGMINWWHSGKEQTTPSGNISNALTKDLGSECRQQHV